MQLLKDSLDKLQDRVVGQGEGWQRARDAFSRLLGQLGGSAYLASKYIGGEYTALWAHRGDADAKLPFDPIPLAKQREAIKLVKDRNPLRISRSSFRRNCLKTGFCGRAISGKTPRSME